MISFNDADIVDPNSVVSGIAVALRGIGLPEACVAVIGFGDNTVASTLKAWGFRPLQDEDLVNATTPIDACVFATLQSMQQASESHPACWQSIQYGAPALFVCGNRAHGSWRLAALTAHNSLAMDNAYTISECNVAVSDLGLTTRSILATVADVLDSGISLFDPDVVPAAMIEWARHQPHALEQEFIVVTTAATGDQSGEPVQSQPLADYPAVWDQYSDQAQQIRHDLFLSERRGHLLESYHEDRYTILTQRDRIIGLEAELGKTRAQLQEQMDQVHMVRKELIETHAHLADSIADDQKNYALYAQTKEELERIEQTPPLFYARKILRRAKSVTSQVLRKSDLR